MTDEPEHQVERVGYAPGAYDLFHIGHLNLLLRARSECDRLIAGVATERMCLETKGKAPVVPLAERMEILRHIDVVDEVVLDDSRDKREVWHRAPYTILFKGDDWRGTERGTGSSATWPRSVCGCTTCPTPSRRRAPTCGPPWTGSCSERR